MKQLGLGITMGLLVLATGCATPQPQEDAWPDVEDASLGTDGPDLLREDAEDDMTVLGTYRFRRQIAMYYLLDLKQDNYHAEKMASVMRANEEGVRSCYTSRLATQPKLKGRLALKFRLSKSRGSMDQIQRYGGEIGDPMLVDCITKALGKLAFNPPRTMRGHLIYTFNVTESAAERSEEGRPTVARSED